MSNIRNYINIVENGLFEATGEHFYHGSKKSFQVGFVLEPQSDGYVHGVYGDAHDLLVRKTEAILEKYRPSHLISRLESVFIVDDFSKIEHAGGYTNYIYEVKPSGNVEKACLWWYAQIENEHKIETKDTKLWALNYWNCVLPPAGSLVVFEYRCRSAVIKRIMKK